MNLSDGPSCTSSTAFSREGGRRGQFLGPPRRLMQPCGWTCRPCKPNWRGLSSWMPCASTASVRPSPPPLPCAGPAPRAGAALPAAQPSMLCSSSASHQPHFQKVPEFLVLLFAGVPNASPAPSLLCCRVAQPEHDGCGSSGVPMRASGWTCTNCGHNPCQGERDPCRRPRGISCMT